MEDVTNEPASKKIDAEKHNVHCPEVSAPPISSTDTEEVPPSEKAAGAYEVVDSQYKIPKKKGKQSKAGSHPLKPQTFGEIVHFYSVRHHVIPRNKIAWAPTAGL